MTIGIMTAIGIEEVKNIRDIGIERRDQSQPMFATIAAGLAIGPMSVTCRKSRSKLFIFYNIIYYIFIPIVSLTNLVVKIREANIVPIPLITSLKRITLIKKKKQSLGLI